MPSRSTRITSCSSRRETGVRGRFLRGRPFGYSAALRGGRLSLAAPSPIDVTAGKLRLAKSSRARAMKRRARRLDAAKGRMRPNWHGLRWLAISVESGLAPVRAAKGRTGKVCDGKCMRIYLNREKCQFKELSTFQWLRVPSHFAPSRRPAVSQIGFACVRRNQFLTKCNPDAVAEGFSFPLGWVWHTEVRQVRGRLTDERHVHPQRRATADGPDASR